mmetsp:Transcript_58334/g.133865  ORF Transcript_58334/g.133865 Transcript_58334/m.133865 type:complete len:390 (+) Transcript_58334:125-1294(+)
MGQNQRARDARSPRRVVWRRIGIELWLAHTIGLPATALSARYTLCVWRRMVCPRRFFTRLLLVGTALEEVEIDQMERREEARLLRRGCARWELDDVVAVGHPARADAAQVAARPMVLERSEMLRAQARLPRRRDGHREDGVEAGRRAAVAAAIRAQERDLHVILGKPLRVLDGVAAVRPAAHAALPFHRGAADRDVAVESAHLLRVEEVAAARERAPERPLKDKPRHLALGPAEAGESTLPQTVARLPAADARREVPEAQLAALVEAVAAEARRVLAHLKGAGVEQRAHLLVGHVRGRRAPRVRLDADGVRRLLLARGEEHLREVNPLAQHQARRRIQRRRPVVVVCVVDALTVHLLRMRHGRGCGCDRLAGRQQRFASRLHGLLRGRS